MNVGTRPGPVVALFLSVRPDRIRDWKRRGLIGPTCDVETRQEGFDVQDVVRVMRNLLSTRPRVALDDETWRSHADRVA